MRWPLVEETYRLSVDIPFPKYEVPVGINIHHQLAYLYWKFWVTWAM